MKIHGLTNPKQVAVVSVFIPREFY